MEAEEGLGGMMMTAQAPSLAQMVRLLRHGRKEDEAAVGEVKALRQVVVVVVVVGIVWGILTIRGRRSWS